MRKMQAEAAGSRKKVSPQKSSWAGLAASGTPAAWNAGAGAKPKTDRRSDWPTVGSTSTNNWPAVGKTSAPVASTSQWPNLSGGSAKTKPARNPASNAGNSNMGSKWPSVSAVPSQQKQPRKQQQPAKRKTNSVWGNKAAPTKSLSDIQREQQSQQNQHDWPQPQQTHSGELAHNLKNMLGIGGGRSNVSGSRAWGNTSAGPAQPKSLREIQAEEARQKSQNSGRPNHAGGWAAKVSGSKATARTTNSVWGGPASGRAKPMNEIFQEESRKAALDSSVQTPTPAATSTGAKEDELLWGGVAVDIGTINLDNIHGSQSPPQRQQHQQRQERQQHQQHQQHQRQPHQQHQRQQHQTKNKSPNAFGGPTMSPKFRRWCVQEMIRLSGHDDTTLVDYCFTLQSPAEIRESMSGTLGSTPGVSQFASEFIRRKKEQMSHQNRRPNNSNARGRGRGGSGGGRRNRRRPHKNNRR